MKKFFTWCFGVLILNGFSQEETVRLYFAINEDASPENFQRVDSLLNSARKIKSLKIFGYADFLDKDHFNLALSGRRAENIREYLIKHTPDLKIAECKGFGEKYSSDNKSKSGDAVQRRVDLILEFEEMSSNNKAEPKQPDVVEVIADDERKLENLSTGEKLEIEGLNFVPGRHFITKESVPALQKLLSTMQKNPKLRIQIQGHVCCTDGQEDGYDYDTHERKLSVNRARAIHDFLINKGINKNRVSYKGFGHSQPKFPNESTPQEEQANRRVEILVVEK